MTDDEKIIFNNLKGTDCLLIKNRIEEKPCFIAFINYDMGFTFKNFETQEDVICSWNPEYAQSHGQRDSQSGARSMDQWDKLCLYIKNQIENKSSIDLHYAYTSRNEDFGGRSYSGTSIRCVSGS